MSHLKKVKGSKPIPRELTKAFGFIAGEIVDHQIEWKPGQDGRWDVTSLEDGTPRIEFSLFPFNTQLRLRSLNGNVVTLGLEAAALAISQCAMNWTSWQAAEAKKHGVGRLAAQLYGNLCFYIHRGRKSGLTGEERLLIHRYND